MQITFPDTLGNDIVYMDTLIALCGETKGKSLFDAMCNLSPHTPKLGFEKRTYMDILPRTLVYPDEQQYFVQGDVLKFLSEGDKCDKYDTIISSDGIEHLTKEQGLKFIEDITYCSKKQIIFTPLGDHMVDDTDDPEGHHSGWTPKDLDDDWITIIFPKYHPTLGVGAWFAMRCDNPKQEFLRIHQELDSKSWYPENTIVKGDGSLAGVMLIRRGIDLDYCFRESIKSMQIGCDAVFVVYCESTDGTIEALHEVADEKTQILSCTEEQWQAHQGKEKLSIFQNAGIEYAQKLGYEYVIVVQADEVLEPNSYPYIRQAIALGEDGFYCSRINLWGSAETMLNVPQRRKPCSTVVNRLTKSLFRSIDDGESQATPTASLDFINKIVIFHLGFIRNPKKHVEKIKEIQGKIFQMDVDSRVKDATEFDPWTMGGFTKEDVIPMELTLPEFLNDWINKNKANA